MQNWEGKKTVRVPDVSDCFVLLFEHLSLQECISESSIKVKLSYRETKYGKSEQIFWTLACAFHIQTQGHVLCMSKTCRKMNYSMLMVVYTLCLCVCVDQMGKRHFSGLEVTLMVMFSLVLVVAVALIVVLAIGEPGVIREGRWWDASIIPMNDNILYTNAETQTRMYELYMD